VSKNATTYAQRSLKALSKEQHCDRAECNYCKQQQQQNVLYPTFQVSKTVKFQDSCLLASHAIKRKINIQITRYTVNITQHSNPRVLYIPFTAYTCATSFPSPLLFRINKVQQGWWLWTRWLMWTLLIFPLCDTAFFWNLRNPFHVFILTRRTVRCDVSTRMDLFPVWWKIAQFQNFSM
jgi:hypothetical protein